MLEKNNKKSDMRLEKLIGSHNLKLKKKYIYFCVKKLTSSSSENS